MDTIGADATASAPFVCGNGWTQGEQIIMMLAGADAWGISRTSPPGQGPATIMTHEFWKTPLYVLLLACALAIPAAAQRGTEGGEWRFYGGDAGSTKYSPLDQINAENVSELEIVWRWKADNFGPRPDYNWEVTPLMVGDVLYFTAGTRRDAVAVDAMTGEMLWMYRFDEGVRGA